MSSNHSYDVTVGEALLPFSFLLDSFCDVFIVLSFSFFVPWLPPLIQWFWVPHVYWHSHSTFLNKLRINFVCRFFSSVQSSRSSCLIFLHGYFISVSSSICLSLSIWQQLAPFFLFTQGIYSLYPLAVSVFALLSRHEVFTPNSSLSFAPCSICQQVMLLMHTLLFGCRLGRSILRGEKAWDQKSPSAEGLEYTKLAERKRTHCSSLQLFLNV